MLKLSKITIPHLSVRLNLLIACEIVLLLLVSLSVLLYFSRQALKDEARHDSEETLDGTVLHIDNILTGVEQTTYNIYQDLQWHLDDPERMYLYSRKVVESNPNIVGCAIVFKPGYYPDRQLFMAYMRRKGSRITTKARSELVQRETFTRRPYTEQVWYTKPMGECRACWTEPLKNENTEDEPLITFCLPIRDRDGQCVGVVASDVSTEQLSRIVLASKPFPHSYSVLLSHDGSYIVHPDQEKLVTHTLFSLKEDEIHPTALAAGKAMVAGEPGYMPFHQDGKDWYVFYKPFRHAKEFGLPVENLGWSAGMVFLEDDILGQHKILTYLVLLITVLAVTVFFLLCRVVIRRRMKPVRMLTRSAHRIAEGHYDDPVPNTQREDEIGQLQDHFQQMQQSLAAEDRELKKLTATLQERSEVLSKAYGQAQGSDRMKTTFLHYMTTQMTIPADLIERSVTKLSNNYHDIRPQEAEYEVGVINEQSDKVIDLLNNMVEALEIEAEEAGKEVAHE